MWFMLDVQYVANSSSIFLPKLQIRRCCEYVLIEQGVYCSLFCKISLDSGRCDSSVRLKSSQDHCSHSFHPRASWCNMHVCLWLRVHCYSSVRVSHPVCALDHWDMPPPTPHTKKKQNKTKIICMPLSVRRHYSNASHDCDKRASECATIRGAVTG